MVSIDTIYVNLFFTFKKRINIKLNN